jgi:hypothetical protein
MTQVRNEKGGLLRHPETGQFCLNSNQPKMRARLESRLKELQLEYDKGLEQQDALDLQAASLNKTLLRISGAIQVITELLENKENGNTGLSNNGIVTAGIPEKSS